MKKTLILGIALAAAMSLPALAQTYGETKPVHHHHVYHYAHRALRPAAIDRNATAQAAPLVAPVGPSFVPQVAPYPDGVGDEDGLSRHRGDCNKGCIDGPY